MFGFIIKKDCEVKETFSYEIAFNEMTRQSLVEYTHANYGPEAVLRHMTDEGRAGFILQSQDSIENKWGLAQLASASPKSGYDPVRKIAKHRILRLGHVNQIQGWRRACHSTGGGRIGSSEIEHVILKGCSAIGGQLI